MRLGRLFGIPVRVNPLTFLMIALAVWLGEGSRLLVMSSSILLHELSHIAAARMLRVRVIEIELMPAGGAARLESLWQLRPGQMAAVALAGPLCNMVIVILSAALCWWAILPPDWAAALIEQNSVILLFNLLPALPMDGGRVLCGLLGRRMSPACAARTGVRIGWVLAACLMALSVCGLMQGRLNITLPVAALFLIVSAQRERRQAESSAIESLTTRSIEMEEEGVLPVRWLAVRTDTSAHEVAARLRPRFMHMIAVYDNEMKLTGVIGEDGLMRALLTDGGCKIGQMGLNVKKKVF